MGASRALNLNELFNGKGRNLIWMGCTAYGGVAPTSFWGRANGGTRHELWGMN